MKKPIFYFLFCLVFTSCDVDVEKSQNPNVASQTFVNDFLKGNYKDIYKNSSIELKGAFSEESFVNTLLLQKKLYGNMVDAHLKSQSFGKYRTSRTDIFVHKLKNQAGESFEMTSEFLRGHLLNSYLEEPNWREESEFIKNLVAPVKKVIDEQDAQGLHELFNKSYPISQMESLLKKIKETCDGVPYQYESSWMDNDASGRPFIAFVYAYEGKGSVDYRFFIQKDEYPFAAIYFTPDASVKLPNN